MLPQIVADPKSIMTANETDGVIDKYNGSEATDNCRLTNDSICVKPKTCVIHFEPGHKYTRRIKLLNTTDKPQIIQITRPPEGKIFKFSDPTAFQMSTVPPRGSWDLQFSFMSHSNQTYKSYLHLENPTGHRNLQDVELRAVPKTHSSLPRAINFGNVDIGMSVSRKFCLAPESNPYQFRIFIPYGLEGLYVNPTCGKVLSDTPVNVTVTYTPQSCITLCVNLVLYFSEGNQSPQIITLTAVTKPKTNRTILIRNYKRTTTKVLQIPPVPKPLNRKKKEKDILVFNRLTLNKMLAEKHTLIDDNNNYSWLNPFGELDKTYRDSYTQSCEDFVAKANRFGDEHRGTRFNMLRCEPVATDDQLRCVIEQRESEWNAYEKKLSSCRNISCDDHTEPLGLRERSIRMNCVNSSLHDFDPNLDDNWCVRFQTYNKFVTAIKMIIIKNRLKKRLDNFKALIDKNLM